MEQRITSAIGFTLTEVLVALAVLGVALLGLGAALTAAVTQLGASKSRDTALDAVGALATSVRGGLDVPSVARRYGDPGADEIPGTADDGPDEDTCVVRLVEAPAHPRWSWVEAACGASAEAYLTGVGSWRRSPDTVVARLLVRR